MSDTIKIPLVIMTSNKTDWTLGGYFHQLEKYASDLSWRGHYSRLIYPIVCGYRKPEIPLNEDEYLFIQIAEEEIPVTRWGYSFNIVLDYLIKNGIDVFWFNLDDYWAIRGIDLRGVALAYELMAENADRIIKFDLAFDRLYAESGTQYLFYANHFGNIGHLDLIKARQGENYFMSLWGGLFSTRLLRNLIQDDWTPQDVELKGTPILSRTPDIVVLGTRQGPALHTNVCHGGNFFQFEPKLTPEDFDELKTLGLTNGIS